MRRNHATVDKLKDRITNWDEVVAYREAAARKSDFERTELSKEKTGVELKGIKAIDPVNGHEIPVFISDYVLATYGTGAIMAVPAHDTRDWDFAKKFGLPIVEVVAGGDVQNEAFTDVATGKMVNSDFLNGLEVADAKKKIIDWLTETGKGERKVNFKLRDWVFSRQRYWGEPIPLVECDKCGWVPVPEDELPLTLPEVKSYEPGTDGESPLASLTDWIECTCPQCGGKARRETDTMPQWAVRRGTSYAIAIRTTIRHSPPRKRSTIGCRSIGTTAVWNTPRCTSCIRAFGRNSYTTSAFSPAPNRMPSAPRTA